MKRAENAVLGLKMMIMMNSSKNGGDFQVWGVLCASASSPSKGSGGLAYLADLWPKTGRKMEPFSSLGTSCAAPERRLRTDGGTSTADICGLELTKNMQGSHLLGSTSFLAGRGVGSS